MVVVASRSPQAPDDLAHSQQLVTLSADLTDAGQVHDLVGSVVARWGRIDALLHLVGGFAGGHSVAETPPEAVEEMLRAHVRTAFLCCREVVPHMLAQGSGRIVCAAARAALQPAAGLSAYAIAKAGVVALVQTLARELAGTGVTANAIAPDTINTPANRAAMPEADLSRWTPPERIAEVLLFLASSASAAVNGAVLPV